MRRLYRQWIYRWETALADRDTDRVGRPFEGGLDWLRGWPLVDGEWRGRASVDAASFVQDLNRRIVAASDRFFAYATPSDFRLEGDRLWFASPVASPYPENNLVTARWFPAGSGCAVVVLPQWNADAESHLGLCR